jgi:hypothetical protein
VQRCRVTIQGVDGKPYIYRKVNAVVPIIKARLDHVDDCLKLYSATADERTGDLTQRETDQITACKAQMMYPPTVADLTESTIARSHYRTNPLDTATSRRYAFVATIKRPSILPSI